MSLRSKFGALTLVLLAGGPGSGLQAASVEVVSEPPGADVVWSRAGDPVVRLRGPTPAELTVTDGWPVRLCVRRDGYWPEWLTLDRPREHPLTVTLKPVTNDFADIAAVGWRSQDAKGPWVAPMTEPDRGWRVATARPAYFPDHFHWSPDGEYVAWARRNLRWQPAGDENWISTLTLIDVAGEASKRLSWYRMERRHASYIYNAAWSCDGEYLLRTEPAREGPYSERIEAMQVHGGASRVVMDDPTAECYRPAVTGTGRIGYIREVPGDDVQERPTEFWTCDWNGEDQLNLGPCALTHPHGTADGWLLWATDEAVFAWKEGQTREVASGKDVALPPLVIRVEPAGSRVLVILDIWDRDIMPGGASGKEHPPVVYLWTAADGARKLPIESRDVRWLPGGRLLDGTRILDLKGNELAKLEVPRRPELGSPVWSSDGQWLAVQEREGNGLWAVSLDGSGTVHPLPETVPTWAFAWGPNGRCAYVARGRVLMAADSPDAEPRKLLDNVSSHGLSWSPDGTQIACVVGEPGKGRVARVTYPEGRARFITAEGLWDSAIWHPTDTNRIAFSKDHAFRGEGCGSTSYGIMDAQGNVIAERDETFIHSGSPRWTPEGGLMVAQSHAERWTPDGVSLFPKYASWGSREMWDDWHERYRTEGGGIAWSPDGRAAWVFEDKLYIFDGEDVLGDPEKLVWEAFIPRTAEPLQVLKPFGEPKDLLLGIPAPVRLTFGEG